MFVLCYDLKKWLFTQEEVIKVRYWQEIISFFMLFIDVNVLIVFLLNLSSTCLGTLRTIFLAQRILKPVYFTTFIDSIIFVFSITLVAKGDNFAYIIAFALGRVSGIYVGGWIEQKLALGAIEVVVYKHMDTGKRLAEELKYYGFPVNMQVGYDENGNQSLILTIVTNRKNWPLLRHLIKESDRHLNMYIKRLDAAKGNISRRKPPQKRSEDLERQSFIADLRNKVWVEDEYGIDAVWEDGIYRTPLCDDDFKAEK
ncbi:DUF5698 domain-containing protein [Thermosyntropha sp.]|uniref:DUF5698 domain-containing protein n=1 Tax=Thermosyntropha sp. TaxID=2740820 RepID=UPI0025D09B98|nr:DUF5698 domain-containing protein [Thermosyntropha sp.]MBO8159029.1 hypothetical protein [Thermosyntropha sp.]